jgi:hypothetical protein
VREAFKDDGKLIAPDAGQGIGLAHDAGQPSGDAAQDVVAREMPEPIVDLLEAIDVEVQQGQRAVLAFRPGCGVGQAILEQVAVREAGQRIVVGLVDETLQQWLALDRVAHGTQQRIAGVSAADPEILRSGPDHGQRLIRVRQNGKHDDRDAGRLHQDPIDALAANNAVGDRAEQDDIERIARETVEGRAELANVQQINQAGARLVEQVAGQDGAFRVAPDQQRPNRCRMSHLFPLRGIGAQGTGKAQTFSKKIPSTSFAYNHNMFSRDCDYNPYVLAPILGSSVTSRVSSRPRNLEHGTAHAAGRPHLASWKMMPSVWRWPERTRLTPCRMLTR